MQNLFLPQQCIVSKSYSGVTPGNSWQTCNFFPLLTSSATDKAQTEIGRRLRRLCLQIRQYFASDERFQLAGDANYVEPVGLKTKTEHGPVSRKRRRCFEAGHFTGPAPVNHNIIKLYKIIFNVFARILRFFSKSGLAIKVSECAKIVIFLNEGQCSRIHEAIIGPLMLH